MADTVIYDTKKVVVYDTETKTVEISGGVGPQGIPGTPGEKGDKGDKGDIGLTGDPGYTPVFGVDYYTNAQILEVRTAIYNDLVTNVLGTIDIINGEVI